MMDWKLADAKNRLSEVVRLALSEGPQRITRRGDAVIVMAASEYDRLSGGKPGFLDYLREGPSLDGLDIQRDRSSMRDAEL